MTTDQTLRAVVDAHTTFFDNLRQHEPATSSWIDQVWMPWRQRWDLITGDGGELSPTLVSQVAQSLSSIREEARAAGVPLPELSPYAHPAAHLAHIGYPHAAHTHFEVPPPAAPISAAQMPAQIDAETDRRFRAMMGWPESRKIDIHREASLVPQWLAIRYQVAAEFAQANG